MLSKMARLKVPDLETESVGPPIDSAIARVLDRALLTESEGAEIDSGTDRA